MQTTGTFIPALVTTWAPQKITQVCIHMPVWRFCDFYWLAGFISTQWIVPDLACSWSICCVIVPQPLVSDWHLLTLCWALEFENPFFRFNSYQFGSLTANQDVGGLFCMAIFAVLACLPTFLTKPGSQRLHFSRYEDDRQIAFKESSLQCGLISHGESAFTHLFVQLNIYFWNSVYLIIQLTNLTYTKWLLSVA